MNDQPKETLLTVPSDFPIKAFGESSEDFPKKVLTIVQRHSNSVTTESLECRNSQGGKYHAVTITITATSKSQLDAIYQDLTTCPDVIMAL